MARAAKADLVAVTKNVESRLENQDRKTEQLVQKYEAALKDLEKKLEEPKKAD